MKKLPTSERALLIACLRLIDRKGGLLNDLSAEVSRLTDRNRLTLRDSSRLHTLLRQRFNRCSGVGLFIAADNLKIPLPKDLRGELDEEAS